MEEVRGPHALVVALLVLAATGVSPGSLLAQGDLVSLGHPVAWRVSPAVPAGSISGLVLSDRGAPMAGVQLWIEGEPMGVVSGPDGTFTLAHRVGRSAELRIQAIGFRSLREAVAFPADHGAFLTAILQVQSMHDLCDHVILPGGIPREDLALKVVDASTGAAPRAPVTLRLEHGERVWENTVHLHPDEWPHGWMGLGRRIETEGAHVIEVSAPGYRRWRRDDVHLDLAPGCRPTLANRVHRVELIPVGDG